VKTTAGHEVRRWGGPDRPNGEWACAVYDHGPFCRLCQPVDPGLRLLLDRAEAGELTVSTDSTGAFAFAATPEGVAAAIEVIQRSGQTGDPK
jgi:hypothetical protein